MLYQTPKPYVALGTQENFYGTGVPMMSMRQLSKLLIIFHGHHDDDGSDDDDDDSMMTTVPVVMLMLMLLMMMMMMMMMMMTLSCNYSSTSGSSFCSTSILS